MHARWNFMLAVTLLWLTAHTPAAAQVDVLTVLTVDQATARPGLLETLRIQLAGIATVIDGGTLHAGTHSERIEHAIATTELHSAVAAIWIEGPITRSDGTGELVMYVVGRRHDRAIVDVLRVPARNADGSGGRGDVSVDRSLALKVQELLSDLLHERSVIDTTLASDAAQRNDQQTSRALIVAGLLAHTPSGGFAASPGVRAGVGMRVPLFGGSFDWIARAHLTPRSRVPVTEGVIELQDISPALEGHFSHRFGDVTLGARVGAQLRIVDARGQTSAGTVGTQTSWLPSLLAGPSLTLALHRAIEIGLGVDAEVSLLRQRYALNDQLVTDSGRFRVTAHLSLTLLVP